VSSDKNTKTFPDQGIKTPAGIIRVTHLTAKKGGVLSPTRLTGTLWNETGRTWEFLSIRIQPSDGRGTVFNIEPLRLFTLKAGASQQFYFDLTGKIDFPTLSYSLAFQDGSYAANYRFAMLGPIPNERLQFSDELTEWTFLPNERSIGFELVNKSDKSAKLDWNQASYVDPSGKAHKVAGTGTRYIEVNSVKPPTVIPPGARIQDALFPTDYVHYTSGLRYSSGWSHLPIFPTCPLCRELAGAEFRIFMPLEIGGTQKEYTFRIKVRAVE